MNVTELQLGGYAFGQKTFYSNKHLGIDLKADYIEISFPVELLNVSSSKGVDGGLTITGTDKLGFIHRFMHLQEVIWNGDIPRNVAFAITGNSGRRTTSAHLHWDIRKPESKSLAFSNFVDPEKWKQNILHNLITMRALADWEENARKWAIDNGVSTGERPLEQVTRVELWETLRKNEARNKT